MSVYETRPHLVPPAALAACARYVEREWGETGYSMGVANGGGRGVVCLVRHADGSEFFVWSDRYENTGHADTYDQAKEAMFAVTG
jgi:hypothetical protein